MSDKPKPERHIFQVRRKEPRAGRRDPFYTPERDIAHVGPYLLRGAMTAMDPDSWEPWLQEFNAANGITYESIMESKAPLLLAEALNLMIKEVHPPAAMKKVGFDKLSPAMQMLFYARMGQVLLGAIWSGVKDVSRPDADPPVAIEEFLDDVQEAMRGFLEPDSEPDCPNGNGTACEECGSYDPDP